MTKTMTALALTCVLNTAMAIKPNDEYLSSQWALEKIGAPHAWDFGTSGKTSQRDDIVVAVVDEGVDVTHPELQPNIWTNEHEIPGNGIDDDKNGYIDDIHGWDVDSSSSNIPVHLHGTHVAGIIGAKGNNGSTVTGVNWNVKLMPVSFRGIALASFLKSYQYILDQKKLWLSTNGLLGANVVAVNSSLGLPRASCVEGSYTVINDIFNELGKVGVLSIVATSNDNRDNVDKIRDVPSTCESDYIISVTNVDDEGKLNGGWGLKSIDLAAPGTRILSTVPGGVKQETGTSMATPHVSGAVALLTSIASDNFTTLSKENPGKAALELKKIILKTVDPMPSLRGKTVTGGSLNLQKAAEAISKF